MNLAPKPRFLASIRAERGDIVRLSGEAVDNSFDALARDITITITDDEIQFVDDGIGVRFDRFPALFTIGDHVELTSTKLGRFGVGITLQAMNAADVMEVRSVSSDGCFMSRVNWRHVLRDGWEQPTADPIRLPVIVGTPTGATIKLTGVRKLRQFTIAKVVDDLAQRFYPAIADGRGITINGVAVPLFRDPPLKEVVTQSFEFSNGRTATLRAGLLSYPSKTNMNRVHIAFGHRVIMPGSTIGCGEYTGLSNMFARVQLNGSAWALSTFKDDLTDEDQREEIENALGKAMLTILEKCGTVSMETKIAHLGELINLKELPEALAAARPKHNPERIKQPTRDKKKSKPRGAVDEDKSKPQGPARTRRRNRDRLLVTFEGRDALHGIGYFEPGTRINRVNLSPDNPKLKILCDLRDQETAAVALAIIAVQMFEQARDWPQLEIPLNLFGRRVAEHLRADTNIGIQKTGG